MDGLRWLLLIFGLLVIAGVYFYSRREKTSPKSEPSSSGRREPTLGSGESPPEPSEDPETEDAEPVDAVLAPFRAEFGARQFRASGRSASRR
mgnify:CR=1 FL=1